jgi:hypothetical protein
MKPKAHVSYAEIAMNRVGDLLVHTLGSQLRGLKDGQYLLWERPGTRSALTALITEWLEKSRSDGMNVKREYEFLADLA